MSTSASTARLRTPTGYGATPFSSPSHADSTRFAHQVRFELLWRDYFLFISRKFGTQLFTLGGFEETTDPKQAQIKTRPGWWKTWDMDGPDDQPAVRWMQGKTGVPFIDANMVSLAPSHCALS